MTKFSCNFVLRFLYWCSNELFRDQRLWLRFWFSNHLGLNICQGLTITMAKHPSAFKLADSEGDLSNTTEPRVVYEGSVRQLCPLAPNNVSTMFWWLIGNRNLDIHLLAVVDQKSKLPRVTYVRHDYHTLVAQVNTMAAAAVAASNLGRQPQFVTWIDLFQ